MASFRKTTGPIQNVWTRAELLRHVKRRQCGTCMAPKVTDTCAGSFRASSSVMNCSRSMSTTGEWSGRLSFSAARIVENDRLAQADRLAEADRIVQDGRTTVGAESVGPQHIMLGKAKQSAFDLVSLRAENVAWKRIVSYMMQRQGGLQRRSSTKEGWRLRIQRDPSALF